MQRRLFAFALVATLLGNVASSGAEPPAPAAQATLARAEQLERQAKRRYDEAEASLGVLLRVDVDAYAKAESLYLRALDLKEEVLGPWHLEVAQSLSDLSRVYQAQGALDKAERLLNRALELREKALGPQHPEVATNLSRLAEIYWLQSVNTMFDVRMIHYLADKERSLGALHPQATIGIDKFSGLLQAQSPHDRAQALLIRALAINEKASGPLNPQVALDLRSLAGLLEEKGDFAKAERLYARAVDIQSKTLSPLHRQVAISLNGLALLYLKQGLYAKAEPLLVRAKDIREKTLGPWHISVAYNLSKLAMAYQAQGNFATAERLYLRSSSIYESALDPFHPAVASSLLDLAQLYFAQGTFAKAEPLYLRAFDISDTLGPWSPLFARSLRGLATLHQARGEHQKAEPLLVRLAELRETQLSDELSRLSEPRKRALLQMLQGETEHAVSFHAHDVPERPLALETALTRVLRNKGRVLDSLVENQTALRASLTPPLRQQLDQLVAARAQLTAWLYDRKRPADSNELTTLRTRIEELESSLSAASAQFRSQTEPVTVANVQTALPPGAALVELVRYRRFDARTPSQAWKEEHYLAYVLRPSGPPQWIALGEAAPIDGAVDAVLTAMRPSSDAAEARAALRQLHAQVLAPLAGSLQGATHLLIAPDGKLNLVPFEALIDASGDYVLQRHLVSYLTSGRDLLRFAARRHPSSGVTIVAAPDYGPGQPFVALPGAMAEGWELRRAFPRGKLLTGHAASKRAFSRLTSPALLHVATHGFYARGTKAASAPPAARGMFVETSDAALLPPPPPRSSQGDELDALDRAGLALAGANVSPRGIITARELAGSNWSGTQLVVLSACETGVGEVATGEGVYGLRRALVLSGAQTQVVSLWSVADAATLALMRAFYAELARGTGRAESLRRAKLALLQEPRFAHPYYWAAFFAAGDWRPLDKRLFATARRKP